MQLSDNINDQAPINRKELCA